MANKLFNSTFEMKLRIILLLSSDLKEAITIDRIVALDFISCYAADFSLPYGNLHGQNSYKYGEMASRRMLAQEAIKTLVIEGLVNVAVGHGYSFSISSDGANYAHSLESKYALNYKEIATHAIDKYRKESDDSLLAIIQSSSLKSLRVQ